jgi:hypothetical protein
MGKSRSDAPEIASPFVTTGNGVPGAEGLCRQGRGALPAPADANQLATVGSDLDVRTPGETGLIRVPIRQIEPRSADPFFVAPDEAEARQCRSDTAQHKPVLKDGNGVGCDASVSHAAPEPTLATPRKALEAR